MLSIILEGQPVSVNQLYRGRRFLTTDGKRTKLLNAVSARKQYRGAPLEGPVCVELQVYFKSKASSDIDNVCKAALDSLTGILWKDDRQIQELHAYKLQDKLRPRIELTLSQL
ncbi:endodeoxyribonuclease RusA [Nitrobacter hamburgensis X14]|uniref:Endodeoxyribonuclease RusA n=1 Tax=Nitrobacter hamburgensis (strain DSM 10229 / NCIMB 13809 / X14) TaxID=323097 RepID=Q1QRE3_NITHX|nr:RusA family crossover junction endodeoxyribonuclease [Nitrobacter hamburgensis]ABE61204.1 endodeoxyribonuclease RusA [Nitrobacter hamburgensis X14]